MHPLPSVVHLPITLVHPPKTLAHLSYYVVNTPDPVMHPSLFVVHSSHAIMHLPFNAYIDCYNAYTKFITRELNLTPIRHFEPRFRDLFHREVLSSSQHFNKLRKTSIYKWNPLPKIWSKHLKSAQPSSNPNLIIKLSLPIRIFHPLSRNNTLYIKFHYLSPINRIHHSIQPRYFFGTPKERSKFNKPSSLACPF